MKKIFLILLLTLFFSFSLPADVKLRYNQFSESLRLSSSWKNSQLLKKDSDIKMTFIKTSYWGFWNGKNKGFLKILFLVKPTLSLEEKWILNIPQVEIEKKISLFPKEIGKGMNRSPKKGEEIWEASFCLEDLLKIKSISETSKEEIKFYFSNSQGENIYFIGKNNSDLNKFLKYLLALLP